ncbi:MAG: EFR1 family ferrodoxin [Candidatus Methanoplasma sp.]|jgi:ferredoxin|nr:EFR1 family ferrodoxin [Candidatus Methanoplasma sp.]
MDRVEIMKLLYYTATGNSLYVAKRIGGERLSIPNLLRRGKCTVEDDDAIGLVFPCYGYTFPRTVLDFLSAADLKSNYVFAISTYGAKDLAALSLMEKTASKFGISFDYINSISMVDNFIPRYSLESQIEALPSKGIEEHLDKIVADIKAKKRHAPSASFIEKRSTGKEQPSLTFPPDVDSRYEIRGCVKCRTCMKVCPRGNIDIFAEERYFHNCDFCMSCIHNCPSNAIHLPDEKSTARFRNEHVQLREIIESNNQL